MTTLSPEEQDILAEFQETLTPREARQHRAGNYLAIGAAINGLFAFVIVAAGAFAAVNETSDLFITLRDLFLFNFSGTNETALIATSLLIMANISALLVVMVGILAQEIWSLGLLISVGAVNVLLAITLGFTPSAITILALVIAGATVLGDVRGFRLNPVMLKELRERMRGARAFVVITIYLGLMSGFAVLLYLLQRGIIQDNGSAVTGELGRVLFRGIVGIELLLIVFIAPAFTAGAVSNERERKTYDLLQITLLPKPSFIIGKLESALSYIFLLLMAAIPLQSIAFLFGGVSETELILAFVILSVTAITLGTVGLYFSTTVDRTLTASVRAYTVAFAITIGLPIVMGVFVNIYSQALVGTGTTTTDSPILEAAFIYIGGFVTSLNPVLTALNTQELLINQQEIGFWTATLSSDGSTIPMASPWITFTIIYLVVSTILVVMAVRRMRRVED